MTLLFPSPDELIRNINNWVEYVTELEKKLGTHEKRLAEVTAERDSTVSKVAFDLSELRSTATSRIGELELQNAQLVEGNAALNQQMNDVMDRLCGLLEIKRTARTSFHEVMTLATDLVNESKRVIRDNL